VAAIQHWQDPVNALMGAWLVESPWVVGFADQRVAVGAYTILGGLLVAAAIGAIVVPRAWEEWVEVALGVALVASPWVLGFAGHRAAMQNAAFAGLVVAALALWVLVTDDAYSGWPRRRAGS
jgi:hypothetical protein